MVESSPTPWWVLPGLAVVVEFVFVAALVISWMGDDKTLLNVMCTAAITQALLPFSFFFGSSKGSQDKDASMAASAATKDASMAVSSAKKDETIASSAAALAVSVPLPLPPTENIASATPGTESAKPPCPKKGTQT